MAALALSIAGAALGGSVFGPTGAIAGRLIGAIAGNAIDQVLFGGRERVLEGPRLSDLEVMASTEGAAIPRVYGRVCPLWVNHVSLAVITVIRLLCCA